MKIEKYSYKTYKYLFSDFFVFKKEKANGNPEHKHDFIEIVYTLKGSAKQIVDKTDYLLKKGDLLIMNYSCHHAIENPVDFAYYNLLIYCDDLNSRKMFFNQSFMQILKMVIKELPNKNKHGKISFSIKERREIENLFEGILEEQKKENDLYNIMREIYLTNILVRINRKQSKDETYSMSNFKDVLLYIDNNMAENFSLEDFAKRFHYNTTYFSRLFKKNTGQTFRNYIYHKKMEEAANLLIKTDATVDKIIELIGYESHSAFYRNFYKEYRTTPIQFRQKNGQKV